MFSKSASCFEVGVLFQVLCLGRLSIGIQGDYNGNLTEFLLRNASINCSFYGAPFTSRPKTPLAQKVRTVQKTYQAFQDLHK